MYLQITSCVQEERVSWTDWQLPVNLWNESVSAKITDRNAIQNLLTFRCESYWAWTKSTEACSEPKQTSKTDLFVKTVSEFQLLIIFVKSYVLHVWVGSDASDLPLKLWFFLAKLISNSNYYICSYRDAALI